MIFVFRYGDLVTGRGEVVSFLVLLGLSLMKNGTEFVVSYLL
jgi:hypothetical protein